MGLGLEMSTRTGCSSKRDATNRRLDFGLAYKEH